MKTLFLVFSLMLAPFANALDSQRNLSFPASLEGTYVGSIAFDSSSLTIQFGCAHDAGCELSSTTVTDGGEPLSGSQHIDATSPMWRYDHLKSAWQYARDHQSDHISSKEYAAIIEQLQPYLKEYKDIGTCLPLNMGGDNAAYLCSLSEVQSKEPVVLFFGASLTCGEGFCDYVIYPLRKKALSAYDKEKSGQN